MKLWSEHLNKKIFNKICILLTCVLMVFFLSSCGNSKDDSDTSGTINTLEDLNGKRIGSLVGSTCMDDAVNLAGESGEVLGFNTVADLPLALDANKIDAYVIDGSITKKNLKEYPYFKKIDEEIRSIQYGFIFSKTDSESQQLRLEMNQFLSEIRDDGTLDALWDKWTDTEDTDKIIDDSGITGENGRISVATSSVTGEPCVYLKNGELAGIDIELIVLFCAEYGYEPDFIDMDFSGVIAGISTGKYLIGASSVTITEERAKSVSFSDPYYDGGIEAIVKSDENTEAIGFLQSLQNGITSALIAESRWELFIRGAITTLLISLSSLIFGTALGFVVFLICRKGGKIRNKITDACIWLISGMPSVVLLMILFYIVFAAFSIDGFYISIIGFTLIFAAATIGMLRTGIKAIDDGQTEAGIALGYSDLQTFNKIILPQIIQLILPDYQSEAKELLKATAIVGYIAVRDLTKMGDIVRSATYQAILPLIIVAVVYFLLESFLKIVIKRIEYICYERRHNSDILTNGLNSPDGRNLKADGKGTETSLGIIKQSLRVISAGQEDKGNNPREAEEIIRFEHLCKSYGDTEILKDINLTIYKGDVVAVIGPSGCGKSTLLRCLNFLDPPTSGTIFADGLEITGKGTDPTVIHKHIGTVFQRWNLFNHWTVIENLMIPQMDLLKLARQEAYDRSMDYLTIFGLSDKAFAFPSELSGGQQQRIAIIRTLILKPDIVVLDEPTSALDPCMVGEVQTVLSYFAKSGTTMLIVSHDMNFSRNICNRVVFLDNKGVYEEGAPDEIFENPQLPRTRAFINQMKYRGIEITSSDIDVAGLLGEIDSFCIENRIPVLINNRIKDVFITLGLQIILPHLSDDFRLRVAYVYSEKLNEVRLVFFYTGDTFNPESASGKGLWEEAKVNLESWEYKEFDDEGFTNWFVAIIKGN